jgi:hypothetical protein
MVKMHIAAEIIGRVYPPPLVGDESEAFSWEYSALDLVFCSWTAATTVSASASDIYALQFANLVSKI